MDFQKKFSFDELNELNKKFDRQLKSLQSREKPGSSAFSFSFRTLIYKILLLAISLIIPFIVLIRVSVAMYVNYQLNGWIALLAGVAATIFLLIGYALFFAFQYGQKVSLHKYLRRGIVGLVVAYTLYGLLYFSGVHAKTEQIKSYYHSLHPIMRVALATTTLANSDLLITDIQREPSDYTQMGLAQNPRSLHYIQSDGYVHAVDLRTKGRWAWENWLTQITFDIAGLETIRHVGTADHLHVYLPLND
jgi:hypothetical protein